jgi:hypothetical protein
MLRKIPFLRWLELGPIYQKLIPLPVCRSNKQQWRAQLTLRSLIGKICVADQHREFLEWICGGGRDIKLGLEEAKLNDSLQEFPIGVAGNLNFVRIFVRGIDKKEPTEVI